VLSTNRRYDPQRGRRRQRRRIRPLVISYELLGTREWFVIHHSNCGMELFKGQIISGLLARSLHTASSAQGEWKDTGPARGRERCPRRPPGGLHALIARARGARMPPEWLPVFVARRAGVACFLAMSSA
jgi:hypothetical protein